MLKIKYRSGQNAKHTAHKANSVSAVDHWRPIVRKTDWSIVKP